MPLDSNITFINYDVPLVGANHPLELTDTLNTPLKQLIAKFENGNADTQVTRTHIKIGSATDITAGVVDDDIVYYNFTTSKFDKASDDRALGIIDVTNLIVYIFGMYTLKSINTLVPGTKYYLDESLPGKLTTLKNSGVLIGIAFDTDQILNVTTSGSGGAGFPIFLEGDKFNEISNDGTDGFWSPIRLNPIVMPQDFVIPVGANGSVVGPFSIDASLTISDGSVLVIH